MRFDRTAEALLYAFSSLPNQDISKCLKPLNPIIPSSSNYNSATQSYNLAITFKPNYLIYPTNSAQISLAVDCAKRFGSKVTVRSGGHSYAAGGLSRNIVVSLDNFKSISCNSGKVSVSVPPPKQYLIRNFELSIRTG